MRPILLLSALALLFNSCNYQLSTHNFYYHGTDAMRTDADFTYVRYGVVGTSTTTYSPRGGGQVEEGLIADAKRDMTSNFPLGKNQTYANLSIDIIETQKGKVVDHQYSASKVILQCTISADIIQYGDLDQSVLIETGLTNPNTKSLETDTPESDVQNQANALEEHNETQVEAGSFVEYTPAFGPTVKAKVLEVTPKQVHIEFENKKGKLQKKWVSNSFVKAWID